MQKQGVTKLEGVLMLVFPLDAMLALLFGLW